jgi:hypothetical protein
MDALTDRPSRGLRRPFRVRLLLASAVLLVLLPDAARAIYEIDAAGVLLLFGIFIVLPIVAVVGFTAVTCFLEGYIMNLFLKLGYRRCFWYAVVANLVSMGLGLIWYYAGVQVGWKAVLMYGEFGTVALLLACSFVITVAEETVVVVLMVRKQRDFETTFKAVAAANAVSYALLGVITALIGLARHP